MCVSYRDKCTEEGVKQRSGGRAFGETAPKTPSGGISRMGSLSRFLLVALSAQIFSINRSRSLGVLAFSGCQNLALGAVGNTLQQIVSVASMGFGGKVLIYATR